MRIGIDARLSHQTGVGRYVRNLITELHKIDTKNHYILFVQKGVTKKDLGITHEAWKVVETDIRWHTVEEQLLFYKVLENEYLDLVHFPYFSIPILYNGPFVITIHDLIINHFPTGKASTLPAPIYYIKRMAYQVILKQAAKKAQKIIAVSKATQQEIITHLSVPKDKIAITYEGVDEVLHRKTGNASLLSTIKSPFFLYVGNAYPHKNIERLIDAFALVLKSKPQAKLVLVGAKNYFYNRHMEKVKKMDLEENIIFFGSATDEELTTLYKKAEAFIFPSLMEGFGLPGLEAMQLGCLVLASDIPVFNEIYNDSVVYFNPLDIHAMNDTMQKVLRNKSSFSSYKEKGFKQAQKFSWQKMAKETLKIYEDSVSLRSSK